MEMTKLHSTLVESMRNIAKANARKDFGNGPLHVRKIRANQQMDGVVEVAKAFGLAEDINSLRATLIHDYVETANAKRLQNLPS